MSTQQHFTSYLENKTEIIRKTKLDLHDILEKNGINRNWFIDLEITRKRNSTITTFKLLIDADTPNYYIGDILKHFMVLLESYDSEMGIYDYNPNVSLERT